ncbi:hypothetical protein BFF78_00600 [Streptomyces fodineus]|uniref:Uncharacterized protein n=1 Tax=Streptomyces fodineus TaxID=1904616 RepID=A0A1D7YMQ3_9ACTN|nr:hypothetical protein BFF78_00600 [Streptomyces fodineus]
MWRRLGRGEWQTLHEALDNPDGDRLYAVQHEQACRSRAEREAAEREAQRPVCIACGQRFTDDRWNAVRGRWKIETDGLCRPCLDAHRERAEAASAARYPPPTSAALFSRSALRFGH